jgi:hypothetical protein
MCRVFGQAVGKRAAGGAGTDHDEVVSVGHCSRLSLSLWSHGLSLSLDSGFFPILSGEMADGTEWADDSLQTMDVSRGLQPKRLRRIQSVHGRP